MFEWRVKVRSPMRVLAGDESGHQGVGHDRDLYVWTAEHCAVDAYEEALRVLEGWPDGTGLVEVTPVGMYVRSLPHRQH